MANLGEGVGAKFVSVNLNKSYGQSSHHNHQSYGGSYGQAAGRGRPGSGGRSGGMVVLSRSRNSQKAAGPKLSVPPPLNLPSLRKEHEKFDVPGTGAGPAVGAQTGNGPRPPSSGMGWTKPVTIALQDKDVGFGDTKVEQTGRGVDGAVRFNSAYMPPSARSTAIGTASSGASYTRPLPNPADKAVVLKGEDFPSLKAALPVSSGPGQKQKDNANQKQKPSISGESTDEQEGRFPSGSRIEVASHAQESHNISRHGSIDDIGDSRGLSSSRMANQLSKDDYFSSPLPLVRLNPKSDWADDERDTGHGIVDRATEWNPRERYVSDQSSRYRAGNSQNSTMSKSLFAAGGKFLPSSDSFKASGSDKRGAGKSERNYLDDPFMGTSGFDDQDPFPGSLLGVIKRRKDVVKQNEWRDPARELFEAELEKVQKMQELERQWIMEEQERELEQARREQEERQRLIREEEERQRRLEEETREAAWREEQERMEAHRRAEEQRIAREEEKRRMLMEEERRKQAAKQKLMELEERMAKRQAEAVNSETSVVTASTDEKLPSTLKDNDFTATDLETWEDSEKMVERITSSTSFDTFGPSRPFEMDSRSYATRESSSGFLDRRRPFNSWRRDPFENGSASSQIQEHEISHFSPQRDSFANARAVGRKDLNGVSGYTSSRANLRGMQEPYLDEFGHQREQRWNFPGDAESFSGVGDFEAEFQGNLTDRYGDVGWGQNHFRGNAYPPYPERPYPNSEADELYSYGRSRYSMRQPRVLPPPIASKQRTSFANERSGPSGFLVDNNHVTHAQRSVSTRPTGYYSSHQDGVEQPGLVDMSQENASVADLKLDKEMTTRCDSQSSLSVSSPPSSPPHLSYDELDDSRDSPLSASAEGNHISTSENQVLILDGSPGQQTTVAASGLISNIEDEEWPLENTDDLQEQEEYNEDDDGYQEEDEVREGDYDNLDLNQEFGELHLEDKGSSVMADNMILGFDEGIKVELPNDDFDKNVGMCNSSISIVREQGLGDGAQSDEQSCGQEMERAISDSVKSPDNLYSAIASDGPALSSQQSLALSPGMSSFTSLTTASTASSVPNQVDTPVRLQFGLFSGPPLIPSPVPTIQIGSIQMPLHLHPPTGPSFVHPSQSPIFQFGQVRYTSPISMGVLPIASPSTSSFGQPTVPTSYSLNLNAGGALPIQPSQDTSSQGVVNIDSSSHGNHSLAASSVGVKQSADSSSQTQSIAKNVSSGSDEKLKLETAGQGETKWGDERLTRNRSKGRISGNQSQPRQTTNESISNERNFGVVKAPGAVSKGKRFTYAVKNSGIRSAMSVDDEMNGFQRRSRRTVQRVEFRVRENFERRPPSGSFSSNSLNAQDKYDYNGRSGTQFVRSGSKRGTMSSKSVKQITGVEGSNMAGKEIDKDVSIRDPSISHAGERNVKRNISEEDVDAPLQSGVVRVFKQPGIEAPSDEDDFIEVRSKRQMINDRREQREKEIKAKTQPARKPHSRQKSGGLNISKKVSVLLARESSPNTNSGFGSSEGRVLAYKERSTPKVSLPLAPIGTPAVKLDTQADKTSQNINSLPASSASVLSGADKDHGPNLLFESQNKVMDNVSSSLTSWGNAQFNQQVMALTQTQLEEAMEASRFDSSITSVGSHSSGATEPLLSSSSLLVKERSFTSSSTINSLLAGEKIQFGAVTSPPILPPSSRAPGSSRPETQIPHNLSIAEDKCSLFFKKDKHNDDSCAHLKDSEAEAAASAVAAAVIASDEVVENGMGSIPISESKSYGGANIDGIAAGMGDDQLVSQSKAEESLSVSLPADLSVDTPPISLWPPLPSPHNSSNQMLSHFSGGRPHFPFYEMNPMLGGPIFAFTPSEGSVGTQSQTQKSVATSASGPLATWQHSAVDSFYGHPTGYTGPFIGPPGSIPGVQGSPHMVVYNHFAPVGQFGQVGLSFMGPAYIPSGKPSDGKHNSSSSAAGMGEGHLKNANIVSGQRNHPNMATPIQHLTSGSPIMPFASPLAMFDVSPFQPAPDISVQAHWPRVPAPALHSVPFSRPLQQAEGILPPQLGHINPADQSVNVNRFSESRTSNLSTAGPSFTVASEVNVTYLPDELGLVDTSRSTTAVVSNQNTVSHSPSTCSTADANNTSNLSTGGNTYNEGHGTSGFKNRSSQQNNMSAQQAHSSGYSYQRVSSGTSQRTNAGSEWPYKRTGFHGRNQSFGSEKGTPSSKMKQIYVAKQPTNGTSRSG